MKFLIASDIHGSGRSAERIRKLYTEGSFDKLLLLGDLLYHGPRNDLPPSYNPKKVIEILSTLKDEIISVRGRLCRWLYDFHDTWTHPHTGQASGRIQCILLRSYTYTGS